MRSALSCAAIAICVFTAGPLAAQATRTWVSGVGDDANPCSRTAPCKTFAGAISKTAAGGEIDALDPGGYGAVTITKSVSIEANGTLAGVLVSGTNGIVISAGPSDTIVLRHLVIEGLSTGLSGVKFLAGGTLVVEDTSIKAFTDSGIDFEPNQAGDSHLAVRNASILDCGTSSGAAILVKPAGGGHAYASVENSQMRDSRTGLRAEDNATVTVVRSVASGNSNNGFLSLSNSAITNLSIEDCESTGNGTNGAATSGANAYLFLAQSVIHGNAVGINQLSGHFYSFLNNRIAGNAADGTPAPNTLSNQ